MNASITNKNQTIYQLNVALRESRPLIWRRIQVSSVMALPQLHRTVQIVMGWENYHVHEFRINGKAYGEPNPEDHHFGREVADERRVRLGTVLSAPGSSFEYIYDFGDNWRHDILIEAILPVTPRKRYPVCMDGARTAPPEDVGGIGGYERYLEALFDPTHEEHRNMLEWRGRFDPEYFPITSVNRKLREEFPAPSQKHKPSMVSPPQARPAAVELDEIFRSLIHSGRLPRKERPLVGPEDRIPLPLSARDRELIVEHSLAEEELTERLRLDPEAGKSPVFYFTLDELEDLIGYVAAEANHSSKKVQKEWDVLYDRMAATLDNYTRK
ncbi:MAG: plasmid pRiA4b ORF-3 family protein [Acidobacteriota bacterium]|nr:plasmid pRiA4b ORF-3 family protein [Acidobacteriota bacterium]